MFVEINLEDRDFNTLTWGKEVDVNELEDILQTVMQDDAWQAARIYKEQDGEQLTVVGPQEIQHDGHLELFMDGIRLGQRL